MEKYVGFEFGSICPSIKDKADRKHYIPATEADDIITIGVNGQQPILMVNPNLNDITEAVEEIRQDCDEQSGENRDWVDEGEYLYTIWKINICNYVIVNGNLEQKSIREYDLIITRE